MNSLIIGDVHGCYRTLKRLLEAAGFQSRSDRVWLVGDLVNGGPASLDVLRWAVDLGDRARVVLGNHDLYLLARIFGVVERKRRDTLDAVLESPDLEVWTAWLLNRSFLMEHPQRVMVHAGLLPSWDVAAAGRLARRAEAALRTTPRAFLSRLFELPSAGRHEDTFQEEAQAVQVLTRIRTCREDGALCNTYTGPPEQAPEGCRPWYRYRTTGERPVFFGHWAAHGFRQWDHYTSLDSGCVWGHALTAVNLETGAVLQMPNQDPIPALDG